MVSSSTNQHLTAAVQKWAEVMHIQPAAGAEFVGGEFFVLTRMKDHAVGVFYAVICEEELQFCLAGVPDF